MLSMKNLLFCVVFLSFLSTIVQGSAAALAGTSGLSLYALNANGMVNIGKLSQIGCNMGHTTPVPVNAVPVMGNP